MSVLARIRNFRLYLLVVGGVCLSYGIYQKYWYSDLIERAIATMKADRLDGQYLEQAAESLFTSEDVISFDMGVRAYRAKDLRKASEHFYNVIHNSRNSSLKKRAYYNLGNILVHLELPKQAAEMYRQSLRLDPSDWESKYNLERLYVFYPMAFPDEREQASLNPEPGDETKGKNPKAGHGSERPDI